MNENIRKKNRALMIGLFGLFVIPIFFAWWIFAGGGGLIPENTTNNGVLVEPARPLPVDVDLPSIDGKMLPTRYLEGKWTLLYIQDQGCNPLCMEILHRTRQIRLAQGEETLRVQRLFLMTSETPELPPEVKETYPNLDIAFAPYASHKQLLDNFFVDETKPEVSDRVFMIDPLGNLMMYYEATTEPNGILRDLRKLLKWSQVG